MTKRTSFRSASSRSSSHAVDSRIKTGDLKDALIDVLREPSRADARSKRGNSPVARDLSPPAANREKRSPSRILDSSVTGQSSKRHKSEKSGEARKVPPSGSESKAFHWSYDHKKNSPIVSDREGLAQLFRHFKDAGCQLPPLRSMLHKEAFTDVAYSGGQQYMAAVNKLVALFHQDLKDSAHFNELEEAKGAVSQMVESIRQLKEEAELNAPKVEKYDELVDRVSNLEATEFALQEKLQNLTDLYATSEKQLAKASELNESAKEEFTLELRRSVRAGRREIASEYGGALHMVMAHFKAKEVEAGWNTKAQEVVANLELLDQILQKEITDLPKEVERLKGKQVEFDQAYLDSRVPAISISKLNLTQVSDDTVEGSNARDVPAGVNEFGSNLGDVTVSSPNKERPAGEVE